MILKSLYLHDFMKYQTLSLPDLPVQGVVGIVGENESGKSTILEAVTFALYGRTLKVAPAEIVRLIHWKSQELEVRLDFYIGESLYRVVRAADRHGNRRASLYRLTDLAEELLVQGAEDCDRELQILLRISFEIFSQSFYLGQKELRMLHEDRASSVEILEQMTGLDRLQKAKQKTLESIPLLQSRIADLQGELGVARAHSLHFAEQLRQKEEISQDKKRQKDRLDTLFHKEKQEEAELKLVSTFKQRLNKLSSLHRSLRSEFFGSELLRRLGLACRRFLLTREMHQQKIKKLEDEVSILKQELSTSESKLDRMDDLHQGLHICEVLVDERKQQIERNARSHYGSQNVRSHFLPDSLKDKQVILDSHLQDQQHLLAGEVRAYNFSLGLVLLYVVGCVVLGMEYGANAFSALPEIQRLGLVLFGGSGGLLLLGLLVNKHHSVKEAKAGVSRIELSRSTVDKDLQLEESELAHLRGFKVQNIQSLEYLTSFRNGVTYERLRQVLTDILERFTSQPELFALRLQDAKQERERLLARENQVATLQLEIQTLLALLKETRTVSDEVSAFSFLPSPDAVSADGVEILTAVREIYRLKELLLGDFSYREAKALELQTQYHEELKQIVNDYASCPQLLPGIFDEKRLRFELSISAMSDLDLNSLLDKQRQQAAQDEYFVALLQSWVEKLQKQQETVLRDEMGRQSAEQRIQFMEDALDKIRIVEKKDSDCRTLIESLEKEIVSLQEELRLQDVLSGLLQGTIDSLRARLSPNLSRFIGQILPRITNGRYDRVKVGLDLEIVVFSADKEGYIDFTALSGGTADQLLLCLRLAFAASLLQTRFAEDATHLLFLDEPLAAFDAKRAVQFLDLIREFHPGFVQTFLITHNQQLLPQFRALIRTGGAQTVLEAP